MLSDWIRIDFGIFLFLIYDDAPKLGVVAVHQIHYELEILWILLPSPCWADINPGEGMRKWCKKLSGWTIVFITPFSEFASSRVTSFCWTCRTQVCFMFVQPCQGQKARGRRSAIGVHNFPARCFTCTQWDGILHILRAGVHRGLMRTSLDIHACLLLSQCRNSQTKML